MNRYLFLALAIALASLGCGKGDSSSQPAPTTREAESTPPVTETTPPVAEPPHGGEPATTTAEPSPVVDPTPTPVEVTPAEREAPAEAPVTEPDPTPAPAASDPTADVVDPGGTIEVSATKPGLTRIGAAKCKTCHKVQFESWAASAHALRTPPLDCEGCHGPGSEYKALAVMKDPVLAAAAGLVEPDRAFCAQCHVGGWSEDLMQRAHAHKSTD